MQELYFHNYILRDLKPNQLHWACIFRTFPAGPGSTAVDAPSSVRALLSGIQNELINRSKAQCKPYNGRSSPPTSPSQIIQSLMQAGLVGKLSNCDLY